MPRRRRWRSRHGGCGRSRCWWCSPRGSQARSCAGCQSWQSAACRRRTPGSCWARRSDGRWISRCGTRSWPRRRGTRWRCWNCREGFRRPSWPAGSGSRMRCRWRARLRKAFCGGSTPFRPRPGCCSRSRPPSQPVTRHCYGAPPGGWESRSRPPHRRPRPGCCGSAPGCASGISCYGRRPTGRRRCRTGRTCTVPWPKSPTRRLIRTAGPGTAPRPRPVRMRMSQRNWSAWPAGLRREGAWPQVPRSWNGRRG